MSETPEVVIVGGGFGGLYAAQHLRHVPTQVTLVDRRNFHLFQPLLYQVATGGLSPADIAAPLRAIVKRHRRTRVLLGEVVDLDPARRVVGLRDGELTYDTLVLATGASHHYFGHPEWETVAPGLKTIEDATEIRGRLLFAFEAAEREPDPEGRQAWLTFVVVGAGPTGLELAGAICEIARHTLKDDFRSIDPRAARVLLVEATDRVLPPYPPDLSARAAESLRRLGAVVRTGTLVTAIRHDSVTLKSGDAEETVPTHTVLWAAGVQASPLGRLLAERTGAALDRAGRVMVGPDLSVPGHPEIFVIGDLAHCLGSSGKQLPGVAPVAMQQGRDVALRIAARLEGRTRPPFRYRDRGSMATIGRAAAVADLGFVRFGGYAAWLTWLFIHLLYIVEFQSRVLVLVQWAWNYATRNRSARLITFGKAPGRS